jgi:hypothetical protein
MERSLFFRSVHGPVFSFFAGGAAGGSEGGVKSRLSQGTRFPIFA